MVAQRGNQSTSTSAPEGQPSAGALSPADAAHLLALLTDSAPPAAAAHARGLTPEQAVELIHSPAAQERLRSLALFAAVRRDFRADAESGEFIDALRKTVRNTEDDTERRQASAVALRALRHPGAAARYLRLAGAGPPSPSPGGGRSVTGGTPVTMRAPSASTAPRHPPTPAAPSPPRGGGGSVRTERREAMTRGAPSSPLPTAPPRPTAHPQRTQSFIAPGASPVTMKAPSSLPPSAPQRPTAHSQRTPPGPRTPTNSTNTQCSVPQSPPSAAKPPPTQSSALSPQSSPPHPGLGSRHYSPSPPSASAFPCETHCPESAVRTQLDALRNNNQPEPDSGIGTVYAFTAADDLARPIPWPRFIKDFYARLAHCLLGFIAYRTRLINFKRGCAPTRRDPGELDGATIRVDLDHPNGRAATVLFHLAHHPIPGSLPVWLTREIEVLDTS